MTGTSSGSTVTTAGAAARGSQPAKGSGSASRFLAWSIWASQRLVAEVLARTELVEVYCRWRPNLPDESDNHLLELAVAAGSATILTFNRRDFSRGELRFPDAAMAETAALLADEVLPERPLRQWVLSLPRALRVLLKSAGLTRATDHTRTSPESSRIWASCAPGSVAGRVAARRTGTAPGECVNAGGARVRLLRR